MGQNILKAALDQIIESDISFDNIETDANALTQTATDNETDIVDLDALLDIRAQLASEAERLPNTGTYKATEDTLKDAKKPILGRRAQFVSGRMLVGMMDGLIETSGDLKSSSIKTRKRGQALYDLNTASLCQQQAAHTVKVIGIIDEMKTALVQHDAKGDRATVAMLLKAEAYLVDRFDKAQGYLDKVDPQSKNDPTISRMLRSIGEPLLKQAEVSKQEAQRRRSAQSLSTQVTTARNVIKGGGRLEGRKEDDIKGTAAGLHKLSKMGQLNLNPEDNGLIMAIATEQFEQFCTTLDQVIRPTDSRAVEFVQNSRPEAINALREFSLDVSMAKLQLAISSKNSADLLRTVLSAQQFAKLRDTVDQFFEDKQAAQSVA